MVTHGYDYDWMWRVEGSWLVFLLGWASRDGERRNIACLRELLSPWIGPEEGNIACLREPLFPPGRFKRATSQVYVRFLGPASFLHLLWMI
jgi:hypothetical protein